MERVRGALLTAMRTPAPSPASQEFCSTPALPVQLRTPSSQSHADIRPQLPSEVGIITGALRIHLSRM